MHSQGFYSAIPFEHLPLAWVECFYTQPNALSANLVFFLHHQVFHKLKSFFKGFQDNVYKYKHAKTLILLQLIEKVDFIILHPSAFRHEACTPTSVFQSFLFYEV